MKKILLLCLFALFYSIGITQKRKTDSDPTRRKFELGVNATHFLSNIFSLSNEKESTRYAFTTKLLHNHNFGTRLCIGGNLDQKLEDFGNKSFDLAYDLRLGFEYKKHIGAKFDLLFGIDIFGQYQKNETTTFINSGFISAGTTFSSLGLGPALRIEYALTDRIVLMTEAFLYGSSYRRKRNENGVLKMETGYNSFLSEPTSLFISYKF